VREHERVVVHVDDAGLRRGALGDLVGVVGGGQARADVEELPYPRVGGQVPDGARQEQPGGLGDVHDGREHLAELVTGRPVDLVVVLAAQPAVPDPGRMGHRDVDRGAAFGGFRVSRGRRGIVRHGRSSGVRGAGVTA
jgi:hypothetical protein